MSLSDLASREAVLQAMKEFDEVGRERFLEKYGFPALQIPSADDREPLDRDFIIKVKARSDDLRTLLYHLERTRDFLILTNCVFDTFPFELTKPAVEIVAQARRSRFPSP